MSMRLAALGSPQSRIRRVEAAVKLVVRSSASLDSKKLGDLLPGEPLLVLEELCFEQPFDGLVRARVGRDSTPRGVCVNPIGWVTTFKDGESKLYEEEDGSTPHQTLAADSRDASPSSPSNATRVRARPRLGGLPPPEPSFERMDLTPTGGSMASRIARRRQETAKERQVKRDTTPRTFRAEGASTAPAAATAPAASSSSTADTAKRRKGSKRREAPLLSSGKLLETAAALLVEADAEGDKDFDTVTSQLGKLLVEKCVQPAELMQEWDRNKDVRAQGSHTATDRPCHDGGGCCLLTHRACHNGGG